MERPRGGRKVRETDMAEGGGVRKERERGGGKGKEEETGKGWLNVNTACPFTIRFLVDFSSLATVGAE